MKKNNISFGSKALGITTFILACLLGITFPFYQFRLETVIAFIGIVILGYLQVKGINYIYIGGHFIIIENVFRKTIYKKVEDLKGVNGILWSPNWLEIEFIEGDKYKFMSKSKKHVLEELNKHFSL